MAAEQVSNTADAPAPPPRFVVYPVVCSLNDHLPGHILLPWAIESETYFLCGRKASAVAEGYGGRDDPFAVK